MFTTKELSEYLKIHENTVYNFIKKGMPYYKLGSREFRFDINEVKDWLKEDWLKKQDLKGKE